MYKAGVIGERDSIYGFASVGIDVFPAESAADAGLLLRQLVESGYAVIYITEALASQLETQLDTYRDLAVPIVIPIPGISGNTGIGMKSLSKSIERAVGSDILSDT